MLWMKQTGGPGLPPSPSPDQAARQAGNLQAAARTNSGFAVFYKH